MRSFEEMETPILDTTNRLSVLSIVVDDFDSLKPPNNKTVESSTSEVQSHQAKPYTRQSSDAAIRKILEEAEHRKHEFWKLIDEHSAVIENLKKIEQLETNSVCKITTTPSPISI